MPFLMKRRVPHTTEMDEAPWRTDHYTSSKHSIGAANSGLPGITAQAHSRRLCGNADCSSNGWRSPLRSRRRPVFEEQWACSGRCLLTMVRTAASREADAGRRAESAAAHQHRVPLGLLMLGQGWITHPQLRRALEAQRENGQQRIGHWLVRECAVDQEQVTRALALQWGCPVLPTHDFAPEAMALVAPKLFAEQFGMLPLRVAGARILYLGFRDKLDASAALALQTMTNLTVESGVVDEVHFEAARRRLLDCGEVETRFETVDNKDAMAGRITAILEHKQPIASRLARVHEYYWLRLWLESGAFGRAGAIPNNNEEVKDYCFKLDELV